MYLYILANNGKTMNIGLVGKLTVWFSGEITNKDGVYSKLYWRATCGFHGKKRVLNQQFTFTNGMRASTTWDFSKPWGFPKSWRGPPFFHPLFTGFSMKTNQLFGSHNYGNPLSPLMTSPGEWWVPNLGHNRKMLSIEKSGARDCFSTHMLHVWYICLHLGDF